MRDIELVFIAFKKKAGIPRNATYLDIQLRINGCEHIKLNDEAIYSLDKIKGLAEQAQEEYSAIINSVKE